MRARPHSRNQTIRDLPFRSSAPDKSHLGFEIFQLADLYEREARRELAYPLEAPGRLGFNLLFVGLKGKGQQIIDFMDCPMGLGFLTVVAKGRVHQFVRERGVNAWMLLFSPDFVAAGPPSVDPLRRARLLSPTWSPPALALAGRARRDLTALCEHIDQEFRRPADSLQAPLLRSLVRLAVLKGERLRAAAEDTAGRRPLPPALQLLLDAIERDFAKTRSVVHYAREARLSARRLAELLVQSGYPNAKQLICERVILEQKRLLAHADYAVKELAGLTGFDDPTNCVKFFRRHVGMTPMAFRRSVHPERR